MVLVKESAGESVRIGQSAHMQTLSRTPFTAADLSLRAGSGLGACRHAEASHVPAVEQQLLESNKLNPEPRRFRCRRSFANGLLFTFRRATDSNVVVSLLAVAIRSCAARRG